MVTSSDPTSPKPLRKIHVVGALIWRDGLLMLARRGPSRSMPGLWEFPGGKLEPQETEPQALARELQEELSLTVQVCEHFQTVTHTYPTFHITLSIWHCVIKSGEPVLTEHDAIAWVAPTTLPQYALTDADVPVAEALTRLAPWSPPAA